MKLVVLATVAAASLAAAGCGGGDGSSEVALSGYSGSGDKAISAAAPVQQGGVMAANGITVVGTGTADVVPDVADWSFAVRLQRRQPRHRDQPPRPGAAMPPRA